MSSQPSLPKARKTTRQLFNQKGKTPIVCLTAYTTPMAQLLDPHADLLLIGDSLGMVLYGMESTLSVTTDMMREHTLAVMRGSEQAAVVIDLPFGSYQESKEQAYRTASQLMAATHATAVKLEGGKAMAETVAFLVERGIPVMGHIGLMPQHVHALGGYRYQGRNGDEAARLLEDAQAIAEAGAFAIVLEGVAEPVAEDITKNIPALTIGIGASPACDGQVLVSEDMLGLTPRAPGFVKSYAQISETISAAVQCYAEDVRTRRFPDKEQHCFTPKE